MLGHACISATALKHGTVHGKVVSYMQIHRTGSSISKMHTFAQLMPDVSCFVIGMQVCGRRSSSTVTQM